MSLRAAIEALVSAAPADATIPVRWLSEQLAAEPQGNADTVTVATDGPAVDFTVPQLAARFGKGPSTIRSWLAAGDLPGAYRLHGREWRIPASAVDAMQRAQAASQRAPERAPRANHPVALSEWRKHLPASNANA